MSGVVLAGGASRRMGTDKATLTVDGETLLARAARHLSEAGARTVVLATGTAGRLGPDLPHPEAGDGDEHRGAGPLAGILAALRHPGVIEADHPVLAVLAVDLPDASPDLLRWLRTEQWRDGVDRALVPLDATGRPQPLHALYAVEATVSRTIDERLRSGDRRVLGLLDALGARTLRAPSTFGDRWCTNWNRPHPGWVG